MSIFPATDMIVDVARAADPAKRDMATRRLSALAQGADFTLPVATEHRTGPVAGSPPRTTATMTAATNVAPPKDPLRSFEAFVLQSFIEEMLPKQTDDVYGHGTAGGIWRSMMAEHVAARITEAGGFGLRKTLESGHSARSGVSAPQLG